MQLSFVVRMVSWEDLLELLLEFKAVAPVAAACFSVIFAGHLLWLVWTRCCSVLCMVAMFDCFMSGVMAKVMSRLV